MLKRTKPALEVGTLKGILWHQGESDSNEKLAPTYEAKLHVLVKAFRKELNTDAPFVIGQLGRFDAVPWNESRKTVDRAHRELEKHFSKIAFVPSEGLKAQSDNVHFGSASYREFGKRYAAAYLKLTQAAKDKP
ncbi:MAG: sialate O-acetylesterase [Pirellulales bacterium]